MPALPRRRNRGPAIAASNRGKLIDAARVVFARDGYLAPVSTIAREAGVGQAVLYRHFPSRTAIALAVFNENIEALEGLARDQADADSGFLVIWRRIVEMTLENTGFIDALLHAGSTGDWNGPDRMLALIREPLEKAQRANLVPAALDLSGVQVLTRAIHGVCTGSDPEAAVAHVHQLLSMIDERLVP